MKKHGLSLFLLFVASGALAMAEPTIHVSWEENVQLVPGFHYEVDTSDPDFPNVKLNEGSWTWRVWSTDSVAGPGDIGEISSPANANFRVTILTPPDEEGNVQAGARNINSTGGPGRAVSDLGGRFRRSLHFRGSVYEFMPLIARAPHVLKMKAQEKRPQEIVRCRFQ